MSTQCRFEFFYHTTYYFNFKYNNFKCLYLNTHSHSNIFKMINSFCSFQMRINKIVKITINKQGHSTERKFLELQY